MSHWANIKTQVRDIAALTAAVMEMGCTIAMAQPGQRLKVNYTECDGVIRVPGAGDYLAIMLDRQPDGTFLVKGDSDIWSHTTPKGQRIGQNYGTLIQLYGVHAAMAQARRMGHAVARVPGKGGAINVVITGRL